MKPSHLAIVCMLALLTPKAALAHSPIEGAGSFLNGLLHPILNPAHLLLLIALGFHLGQQGNQHTEFYVLTFAVSAIIGLTISWFAPEIKLNANVKNVTLVLALAAFLGLLVAIKPKLPKYWFAFITLLAGCLLGIESAQDELLSSDKLIALLGSGIAIYFLVLYPIVIADYANKKEWQTISIRIIGSWVTASCLFVLTLQYKLAHL